MPFARYPVMDRSKGNIKKTYRAPMKLSMRREQSIIVRRNPKVNIKSCTGVRRGNIVFFTLITNS